MLALAIHILEILAKTLGLASAILGVISAVMLFRQRKAGKGPSLKNGQKNGQASWRPWGISTLVVIVLAASASGVSAYLQPRRIVTITSPSETVDIDRIDQGEEISYTFRAEGTCENCAGDERVQLFVLPPQGAPWVAQRYVPIIQGKWKCSKIYVGNRENSIKEGNELTLQAVVVRQGDVVDLKARPNDPSDLATRGISAPRELKVHVRN